MIWRKIASEEEKKRIAEILKRKGARLILDFKYPKDVLEFLAKDRFTYGKWFEKEQLEPGSPESDALFFYRDFYQILRKEPHTLRARFEELHILYDFLDSSLRVTYFGPKSGIPERFEETDHPAIVLFWRIKGNLKVLEFLKEFEKYIPEWLELRAKVEAFCTDFYQSEPKFIRKDFMTIRLVNYPVFCFPGKGHPIGKVYTAEPFISYTKRLLIKHGLLK